jgi:hypothetical protein
MNDPAAKMKRKRRGLDRQIDFTPLGSTNNDRVRFLRQKFASYALDFAGL